MEYLWFLRENHGIRQHTATTVDGQGTMALDEHGASPVHLVHLETGRILTELFLLAKPRKIWEKIWGFSEPIGSMVLVYMLTWLGYIDGKCYIHIYIYYITWILWGIGIEIFAAQLNQWYWSTETEPVTHQECGWHDRHWKTGRRHFRDLE